MSNWVYFLGGFSMVMGVIVVVLYITLRLLHYFQGG